MNHVPGRQALAEIRDEQDAAAAQMLPFIDRLLEAQMPTQRRRSAALLGSALAQAAVSSFLEGGRPQPATYSLRTVYGVEPVRFRVTVEPLEPPIGTELAEIMTLDDGSEGKG